MIQHKPGHSDNVLNFLQAHWFNLLSKLSLDLDLGHQIFLRLIDSYSDCQRQYHNLAHIYHILSLIEQVKEQVENINLLYFAAWYHDYIYNPQALDNEIKSAAYAKVELKKLSLDSEIIESVSQIILSTQNHQPIIKNLDNALFLDIDLAILGTESSQYQAYAQAIRQEYSFLSDRHYQQGRIKVLTNFLARERIYYTDYFYSQIELIARNNIQIEINYLKTFNST